MAVIPILPIFNIQNHVQQQRKYHLHFDPLEEFYQGFQFQKATFHFICNWIQPDLERIRFDKTAVSVETQVACALRFYASGTFLRDVGDILKVNKSTVSHAVRDVSTALSRKLDHFVKFPQKAQELSEKKTDF